MDKLTDLSHTDDLTGLNNRRVLSKCLETVDQYDLKSMGIILFDLDDFKRYNDVYGHMQGDEVLRSICSVLKLCDNKKNTQTFRYGGEEFLIMIENTTKHQLKSCVLELQSKIKALDIEHKHSVSKRVSVSIGCYYAENFLANEATRYLRCADQVLYMSKHKGKNIAHDYICPVSEIELVEAYLRDQSIDEHCFVQLIN